MVKTRNGVVRGSGHAEHLSIPVEQATLHGVGKPQNRTVTPLAANGEASRRRTGGGEDDDGSAPDAAAVPVALPDYMEPQQAGEYLGTPGRPIPVSTLQWWRTKGRGPKYWKAGGRVIYAKSDLDDFRAANRVDPGAAK